MVVTGKEIYIQVDYSGLGDWYTLAGSRLRNTSRRHIHI